MSPVFLRCEEVLKGMTSSEFNQHYSQLLDWTGKPQLFTECFQALREGDEGDSLLSLLVITSTLERALGDVYLLRGQQCPSMLKDLLLTQELRDIFGGTAIQVLRVVIGPPISLNIRNVAWHGFPAPAEIPDRYPWYLLLLVPSLGRCLQLQGVQTEEIPHRPPVTFQYTHLLDQVLPGFGPDDLSPIEELLFHTGFIQSQYRSIWQKGLSLYKQKRYGLCMVLLLPQLEHSLRRVFAAVNSCPERVLTAEATTLYTTFDEILDKYLPSQTENRMLTTIGENCMDLLFDLLVYPDGPRVRDRLSHGETTLDTFPQSLVNSVIGLSVQLSVMFISDDQTKHCQHPAIEGIVHRVSQYKSIFHPISVAKRKIVDIMCLTSQMTTWISYTPQLEPWRVDDGMEIILRDSVKFVQVKTQIQQICEALSQSSLGIYISTQHLSSCVTPFSDSQSTVQDILDRGQISTIYRGQTDTSQNAPSSCDTTSFGRGNEVKESEIVGIISRIISQEQDVMSQVKVAMTTRQEQLKQKQLRSRQRDNLKRLLESLPVHHMMTTTLCMLTAGLLAHLDHLTNLDQPHLKKLQKFLKLCLQYCENMKTFSSAEKNKWMECVDFSVKFLPRVLAAVKDNIFLGSHDTSPPAAIPP